MLPNIQHYSYGTEKSFLKPVLKTQFYSLIPFCVNRFCKKNQDSRPDAISASQKYSDLKNLGPENYFEFGPVWSGYIPFLCISRFI